ncbi:hypothetical protein [Amycolatopsis sp. NPDC098790]|uniref:hypothetical protein n=1 Tax=Amycolatopsis sp. NPDC098790 TaxID=3363939 RepID=UPI0037F75773
MVRVITASRPEWIASSGPRTPDGWPPVTRGSTLADTVSGIARLHNILLTD